MTYKTRERKKGIDLIVSTDLFGKDKEHTLSDKVKKNPHLLNNTRNNLFYAIGADAELYYQKNSISWQGADNILSSQVACLNHLFLMRHNKNAVLNLLKTVSDDPDNFVEVMDIPEAYDPGKIQFEAVGGKINLLGEKRKSRGSFCTSIDALIYAQHRNKKRYLVPIEWKYVESYDEKGKFDEVKRDSVTGEVKRNRYGRTTGEERRKRYYSLVEECPYLKTDITMYYSNYEPFYQLMRQTLWVWQTIRNKVAGFEADDYLHIHVIPEENHELLNKQYSFSQKNMEQTWRECLDHSGNCKYKIVSPKKLMSTQTQGTEEEKRLMEYLERRYW